MLDVLEYEMAKKVDSSEQVGGGDEGESKLVMLSRRSMKGRTGPSSLDDPEDLDCVICGLPRVHIIRLGVGRY